MSIQSAFRPSACAIVRDPKPTMLGPHIFGGDFVASFINAARAAQSRRTSASLIDARNFAADAVVGFVFPSAIDVQSFRRSRFRNRRRAAGSNLWRTVGWQRL